MTGREEHIVELMTQVIKLVVKSPEKIALQVMRTPLGIVLRCFACPEDARQLLGKQRETLKSLQSLALSLGVAAGGKMKLEVVPIVSSLREDVNGNLQMHKLG